MADAVSKLERRFATWLGVPGAVAAGFGRSALALALEAVGVRGGDVLVPDFICTQVLDAVRFAGGRPVFYRVRRNLAVRPHEFQAAFTPATRATIVAHYFGRVLPEVSALADICRSRRIPLIEDCALALGASAEGKRAGTFGDLAVFSFTKSDWCYGGGMVAANSPEWTTTLARVREEKFSAGPKLALVYGLLRRADFAANRPRWSETATRAGRWLERMSGLAGGNFYDAGRRDATMPEFAARRAWRILENLDAATVQRRRLLEQLRHALGDTAHVLLRDDAPPGDSAAFVLVRARSAEAQRWRGVADQSDVTLRLAWPAYQRLEPGQHSEEVNWLAQHLLVLELHPKLAPAEVKQIADVLRSLSAGGRGSI